MQLCLPSTILVEHFDFESLLFCRRSPSLGGGRLVTPKLRRPDQHFAGQVRKVIIMTVVDQSIAIIMTRGFITIIVRDSSSFKFNGNVRDHFLQR